MMHCLDSRLTIAADNNNWILIEKKNGKKERRHFFSSVKHLSEFIGELKLREFSPKCQVLLCDKSPHIPSYSSVIKEITDRLEAYINSITEPKQ
ncbi:hypothetical protein OAP27_02370 [Candidatus Pseudothioglobus singularis]|nr:hypothetical protein [Candidatus Pseudothioglobus singularis]